MKATGIIRCIDDLGRIVIPREIRRNAGLKEGDTIEFYITENRNINLKRVDTKTDILDELDRIYDYGHQYMTEEQLNKFDSLIKSFINEKE